jgi:hypothetical protein
MFTRKIHAAFDYAVECHAGQFRKGTQIPYLSHLMAVASFVMEAAADGDGEIPEDFEDLVVAGLLHNTCCILTDLRNFRRNGQPAEAFWRRFVDDKPDAELHARVPEILWYYQALADVIGRKAAEEAKAVGPARLGRLAGELQSAVGEMVAFAGEAGFEVRAPRDDSPSNLERSGA